METTVSVSFQERAFKILCLLPGNVICADCNAPSPDWASVTLGVFVCHKCSGVHRSIGLHISRIKSTKLDSWSLKHMYMITYANNEEANTYWEANIPDNRSTPDEHTTTDDLTAYIYDKYVHKKFIDPQGRPPLDVIVEKLNLGADKEESESKDQYFNRKLAELDEILRTKAFEIQEAKKSNQPAPNSPKNALHNRLKALKDQKLHRMGSNPNPLLPLSNSIEAAKKHVKKRHVGGSSEFKEGDLFEGLTLKAASTTPKQADSGRDSSESPEMKKKRVPVSFSSKEKPFNLFDSPPKLSKHAYTKSVHVENEREHSDDPLVLDNSQNQEPSDVGDENGEYEDKKTQELQQSRKISPKKNVQANNDEPFFLNATSQDMAKHGTHLKRPSQEFEQFKMEEPPAGQKNRLSPHNRIRPSDPYPWWVVLAGACLLHVGFGYMYSWGSISAYFAIFLHDEREDRVHYLNVASYSALIFLGLSIGYYYPEKMVTWFGFRKSVFFSMVAACVMLCICSLTISHLFYVIVPTVLTGFFIGLIYNIPFYCALQYFTDSGAKLKSLFYIFDGIGAFVFGYSSYLILEADQSDTDYLQEVAYNLPMVVFSTGTKLLIIGTIGSITLKPKFNFVEKDWSALKDKEAILLQSTGSLRDRKKAQKIEIRDLKSAIASSAFKSLLQITVTSSLLGSYYLYGYKSVGLELQYTDHFLTIAGGCGILVMCIGRATAVLSLKSGGFKVYIKWVFIVQALLGVVAVVFYNIFLLYFLPIMFTYGFLHTIIKEEVRSNYIEEIECAMTACAMVCFTLANLIGFAIIKLGEFYMSHAMLNIVLVVPLLWAFYAEMKYERETYSKPSAEESEMTKMMGY